MFAHISLGVTDLDKSIEFYDAVMKTLGHDRLFGDAEEGFMAYGPQNCFFIINTPLDESRGPAKACNGTHICLNAPDKESVDLFYKTALELGGSCDGAPGIREHYAPDYYAAFIRDSDGHKIEAVARI